MSESESESEPEEEYYTLAYIIFNVCLILFFLLASSVDFFTHKASKICKWMK